MSAETFSGNDRARTLPSRAQLLTLVECAEQRALSSGEAYLLRLGVTHLASQLEQAGGRLQALRDERDAAVRERDTVRSRAQVEAGSPLLVSCGYCGAAAGVCCVSVSGVPLAAPHTARLHALRRRLEVAS